LLGNGDQASFNFHVAFTKSKKKTKTSGTFSFSDSAAGLFIQTSKITNLSFPSCGQAHFAGVDKIGKHQQISFTVDVTDNGDPGTLDTFHIQTSTGYSATGNLTGGNISVHN